MSDEKPIYNDPSILVEPARKVQKHEPVSGRLDRYSKEEGLYSDFTIKLEITDQKGSTILLFVSAPTGKTYPVLYEILKNHPLPIYLNIAASSGWEGRKIQVMSAPSQKKFEDTLKKYLSPS